MSETFSPPLRALVGDKEVRVLATRTRQGELSDYELIEFLVVDPLLGWEPHWRQCTEWAFPDRLEFIFPHD